MKLLWNVTENNKQEEKMHALRRGCDCVIAQKISRNWGFQSQNLAYYSILR